MSDKKKDEDELNILPSLLEMNGTGKIVFEDGFENNVNFKIKVLSNGMTTGDLDFVNILNSGELILRVHNNITFKLVGRTDDGFDLSTEQCLVTSRKEHWGESFAISMTISPRKISFPCQELRENSEGLFVRFWITNLHETFQVSVQTDLGELSIRHFKNTKTLENLMTVYHMPTVSGLIVIDIPREKVTTVQETIQKARTIAENFLKITRLAQTCWHSIVAIDAFDKTNGEESHSRVHMGIIDAKIKSPHSLGLTNPAHSSIFFNSAWKGYDKVKDDKYGFSFALEWYVDSSASSILETKFLCLTTSLELLMDKFHTINETELLLPEEKFNEFKEKAKPKLSEILQSMEIDSVTRGSMYNGLAAMKRRSYLEKAKMMLDYWNVKYADVGITLEDMVRIRNEITHKGRFESDSPSELVQAYKGLFTVLTRVFLAMLNYDQQYWDIVKNDFVNFSDVKQH